MQPLAMSNTADIVYKGGCHCGAVRFTVLAPSQIEADRCNCSICNKTGFLHLIVPLPKFKLISGRDKITTYSFNTHVAKHTFCSICGVKSFYTPRSNPNGISVNVNCLDEPPSNMIIVDFDGQNWEANAQSLSHKAWNVCYRTTISIMVFYLLHTFGYNHTCSLVYFPSGTDKFAFV